MTPWIDSTVTGVDRVWQVLDAQVEAGHMPGYVAAVRIRGSEHVRAGGRTAVEPASPPMRDDTQFRIASVTKPMGAALTLTLVATASSPWTTRSRRWLPEAAEPRVLVRPTAPSTTPCPRSGPSPSATCSPAPPAGASSWSRRRCRRR